MNPLLRPKPLPPGGTIAVLAASSPSEPERILAAGRTLEEKGYRVRLAPNLYERERTYLAGPDAIRLAELNRALRDPEIDALMFARGGYGAMRILPAIDFAALAANPRPLIGYSDLTALHQAVAREIGLSTFHGPMLNFDIYEGLSEPAARWFDAMLAGEAPLTWPIDPAQILAPGHADGILFGGCLSLTLALMGTPYDYWIDGGVWFWEDVDEPLYRLDRMLTTLRLSGRLRSVQGVMVGRLKDCGADEDLAALLDDFFSSAGIPVIRDLPFGHHGDNLLLPIGARVVLDTAAGTITFPEPAVGPSASRA